MIFSNAARFDLLLRARPGAAEKTLDMFEAWDGEIVIQDLTLREDTPQEAPNDGAAEAGEPPMSPIAQMPSTSMIVNDLCHLRHLRMRCADAR